MALKGGSSREEEGGKTEGGDSRLKGLAAAIMGKRV